MLQPFTPAGAAFAADIEHVAAFPGWSAAAAESTIAPSASTTTNATTFHRLFRMDILRRW